MGDLDSQALPFQLKVIEGDLSLESLQNGQEPGVIQLAGWSAPFKPIKYGGTQRVQTTYYPGNPVATQQTIGPQEEPTTVTGEWNDRYLGDGEAMRLRDVFDNIRKRGLSVEVIWPMASMGGTTEAPTFSGNPITRVGMMTAFRGTQGMVQDVQWEAEFTWRSQGEESAKPLSATGALNPRDGFEFVTDDLDIARATWEAVQNGPRVKDIGLRQEILQDMDTAFGMIDSAQSAIAQVTSSVVSALVMPGETALRLIAACSNGLSAAFLMVETILNINLLELEVRDSALDLIRMKDQFYSAILAADEAGATCRDAGEGVAVNIEPDIIAEVRAPAGTDTRDLAIKYYGDPDLHWLIDDFNGFESSAVPSPPEGPSDSLAGLTIKIPRPQPGSSSDLRAQC